MLIDKLNQDMKEAMKAREALRLSVIRLTLSEIKNLRIEKGEDLSDEDVIGVLKRAVKKREEAAEQYEKGGSADRAEQEKQEAELLKVYLPRGLEGAELEAAVDAAIQEANANSMKDLGKVMKLVMGAHPGRVDGKSVQALVRKKLEG